jgi:hypoxanthine-guanine phosphoribosyltransferase
MARQLDAILRGQTAVLVPVMIGGLWTAMKIADKMNTPVAMDPVKTRSYNGRYRQGIEFDYAGCEDWCGRIVVQHFSMVCSAV